MRQILPRRKQKRLATLCLASLSPNTVLTIFPSGDTDAPTACGDYFPIQAQPLIALLARHHRHIADVAELDAGPIVARRLQATPTECDGLTRIPVIPIAVSRGVPESELPEDARQQAQFAPGEVVRGLYVVAPANIIATFTGIAR